MRRWLVALGALVTGWTMIGIPAHATYGARVTADEPQYLLTAISIGEDGDLDISDELEAQRYRPFHRVDVDAQTYPLDTAGRQISPHDPLLPLLLAVPMRLGGWVAAKATLAAMAGLLAVLTAWTAVRRFRVRLGVAVPTVAIFACTAPLATYATQVYPEIPAALAVMVAVAAITARRAVATPDRSVCHGRSRPIASARLRVRWFGPTATFAVAVIALPWLSIKYAPVAAALAAVGLWSLRGRRREALTVLGVFAVAGAAYLLAHRSIYGGWTAYATGDYFSETGEFTVVGSRPNYLGRSRRLVGLLVDDGFGIAAWMIGWLALPFALGVVLRRRVAHRGMLLAPLATGWLVATFVALTMHGWWWPGRQLVVVLPLGVIIVAVAAGTFSDTKRPARLGTPVGALGAVTWLWTTIEAITRRRTLIVDFDQTANPWMRLWRLLLPDGRVIGVSDQILTVAWIAVVVALIWFGWRRQDAPDTDAGLTGLVTQPTSE